jgi:hypothetical protein
MGITPPIPNLYKDSPEGERRLKMPPSNRDNPEKSKSKAKTYKTTQIRTTPSTKDILPIIRSLNMGIDR